MLSGGALGSLTVGMVTCYMWEHGKPSKVSLGPSNNYSADIERVASVVRRNRAVGLGLALALLPYDPMGMVTVSANQQEGCI